MCFHTMDSVVIRSLKSILLYYCKWRMVYDSLSCCNSTSDSQIGRLKNYLFFVKSDHYQKMKDPNISAREAERMLSHIFWQGLMTTGKMRRLEFSLDGPRTKVKQEKFFWEAAHQYKMKKKYFFDFKNEGERRNSSSF